jgi:hypothetical protein
MNSPELFVGILTLLVAVLAVALTLRQIARSDRDRRDQLQRQEDDDILEWARIHRKDADAYILTRAAPIPDEWRRAFREQRSRKR